MFDIVAVEVRIFFVEAVDVADRPEDIETLPRPVDAAVPAPAIVAFVRRTEVGALSRELIKDCAFFPRALKGVQICHLGQRGESAELSLHRVLHSEVDAARLLFPFVAIGNDDACN